MKNLTTHHIQKEYTKRKCTGALSQLGVIGASISRIKKQMILYMVPPYN